MNVEAGAILTESQNLNMARIAICLSTKPTWAVCKQITRHDVIDQLLVDVLADHCFGAFLLCILLLDVENVHQGLDGAAKDEDSEEDHEQSGCLKDDFEWVLILENGDQREAHSTPKATIGHNELFSFGDGLDPPLVDAS